MSDYTTASHGPIIRTQAWHTTSPEQLERESGVPSPPKPRVTITRRNGELIRRRVQAVAEIIRGDEECAESETA